MLKSLLTKWHSQFGKKSPEVIIRAPGRVNIIGEHTDYNEGWVMPGAMDLSVYILVAKSGNTNHWIADNLGEEYKDETPDGAEDMRVWVKYVRGVLKLVDTKQDSFHILIGGDLPVGAGLSSSSALVCGLLYAFQKLYGRKESMKDLALTGSRVEQEVMGLKSGIMDQFAVMLSEAKKVMMLDCRTREYNFIAATLPKSKWVLLNTKVKHQLVDSDYNERAEECQRAVAIIQRQYPEVKSLRDVTSGILNSIHLPPLLAKRAKFVLEENARVQEMAKALEKKDAKAAGQLLRASHKGLRTDYEVSCDELNHLADFANKFEGVFGARMMGGGFGGCVLCLVNEKMMDDFLDEVKASYFVKYNYDPDVIHFELGKGAEIVNG